MEYLSTLDIVLQDGLGLTTLIVDKAFTDDITQVRMLLHSAVSICMAISIRSSHILGSMPPRGLILWYATLLVQYL